MDGPFTKNAGGYITLGDNILQVFVYTTLIYSI